MDWEQTAENWASPGLRGEHLRFHDFPVFHLMSLAGAVKHSLVNRYLDPWGLSMPEWRLLSTVAEFSPIRFARIAQLTAMDKAQVSRALRTAQGKGLVETGILSAERRNEESELTAPAGRFHVFITASGREAYEKVMPLAQRDQLRLIELMTPEERSMMLRIAERIFNLLQSDLEREQQSRAYRNESSESVVDLAQPA